MLNDTLVIIQLIIYTWVIVFFLKKRPNLSKSQGVRFNAERLSGFHFRQLFGQLDKTVDRS